MNYFPWVLVFVLVGIVLVSDDGGSSVRIRYRSRPAEVREVPVPGPERIVEKVVRVPCGECGECEEKGERMTALEAEISALNLPEMEHPLTGLSYLRQVQLGIIFERTKATPREILTGVADKVNPVAREAVAALLGDVEVGRLTSVLEEEYRRRGRDHHRWRTDDPFAQRLFRILRPD